MKAVKFYLVLLASIFMSGCTTTANVTDGTKIREEQGVLVLKVTTALPLAQLQYKQFSTNSSFLYFFAEEFTGPDGLFLNKSGETYWVKPVKAGEYMWSQVSVGSRYAIFHGTNNFTIKPGTITYAGHLTIEEIGGSARIGVDDNEGDMRDYLTKNFPQYLQLMSFEKSITHFRY